MKESIKTIGRKLYYLFQSKHGAELRYWRKCYRKEGNTLQNSFYQKLMLGMAQEADDGFLRGKIVADFGCGPRGSLQWINGAVRKIGIDVLASQYQKAFPKLLDSHGMQYVTCTESSIPLPDASVDVLFTMNSLDHVNDLSQMCSELKRILKPDGILIGSFNLNHTPHKAEPQTLTETKLRQLLFDQFEIVSWRISAPDTTGYQYRPLLVNQLVNPGTGPAILWARAKKCSIDY